MNGVAYCDYPAGGVDQGAAGGAEVIQRFKKDPVVVLSTDACLDRDRLDVALLGEQLRNFVRGGPSKLVNLPSDIVRNPGEQQFNAARVPEEKNGLPGLRLFVVTERKTSRRNRCFLKDAHDSITGLGRAINFDVRCFGQSG